MDTYERRIIRIMAAENCTFSAAMFIDFRSANLDVSSVFDLTDYLEEQLGNLDTVGYMMGIYVGNEPDMELRALR